MMDTVGWRANELWGGGQMKGSGQLQPGSKLAAHKLGRTADEEVDEWRTSLVGYNCGPERVSALLSETQAKEAKDASRLHSERGEISTFRLPLADQHVPHLGHDGVRGE